MPDIATMFDFDSKTPSELEQRRRDITDELNSKYGSYEALAATDIDDESIDNLLKELAALTSTLRRRSSGPPRVTKQPGEKRSRSPKTVDDL